MTDCKAKKFLHYVKLCSWNLSSFNLKKKIEQSNFSVFVRVSTIENDQERWTIPHAHQKKRKKKRTRTSSDYNTKTGNLYALLCAHWALLRNGFCVTDFTMFMLCRCNSYKQKMYNRIYMWVCIAHLCFTQSIVSIVTHFDVDGPCCLHGYFQVDFCWFFFAYVQDLAPSAHYYNTYGTYRYMLVGWLVSN